MVINGTMRATIKEMNNKLDEIIRLNFSTDKSLPTKRLDWKFWLGKNNKPETKPKIIDINDNFLLIFLLKNP